MKTLRILFLVKLLSVGLLFMTSCSSTGIQTRVDGARRGSKSKAPKISDVRIKNADLSQKLVNYEDDLRMKDGRIEELEVYIERLQKTHEDEIKTITEEKDSYKESLQAINKEKASLLEDLAKSKEEQSETKEKLKWASTPLDKVLKNGNTLFDQQKWSDAVTAFQNYREKSTNKKSATYALVTYKIGVCFQELGLGKEAETFYKSVVEGFDKKYKAYEFASYRLSTLSQ